MTQPSPLSTPTPWDLVSEGYTADLVPSFSRYAQWAVEQVGLAEDFSVLDVACGPGTLALLAAPRVRSVMAVDFSDAMLECFRHRLSEGDPGNVELQKADGQALPFADNQFDRAFSMFGLMFFPNRHQGLCEIFRVLRPGGRVAISSWTPFDTIPALQVMYSAMAAVMPDLPLKKGALPLSDPEDFRAELAAAGYADIDVQPVTHTQTADNVDALWASMERSNAPLALLRSRLGEEAWRPVAGSIQAKLREAFGAEPVSMTMTALIGTGQKPRS